jgi:large subunit ribosomal protein L32
VGIQKRRHSRARVARKRHQQRAGVVTLVKCPQCHNPMVPHRVCPTCGYYAGRPVIQRETPEK